MVRHLFVKSVVENGVLRVTVALDLHPQLVQSCRLRNLETPGEEGNRGDEDEKLLELL